MEKHVNSAVYQLLLLLSCWWSSFDEGGASVVAQMGARNANPVTYTLHTATCGKIRRTDNVATTPSQTMLDSTSVGVPHTSQCWSLIKLQQHI